MRTIRCNVEKDLATGITIRQRTQRPTGKGMLKGWRNISLEMGYVSRNGLAVRQTVYDSSDLQYLYPTNSARKSEFKNRILAFEVRFSSFIPHKIRLALNTKKECMKEGMKGKQV